MNFQQLKIIREAARRDYNLTEVANMLYTSQSGVSRHIRELEEELGIEIFIRRGKRLLGMTEPGKALLTIAERILNEASNVRRLADTTERRFRCADYRHHPYTGALQSSDGYQSIS